MHRGDVRTTVSRERWRRFTDPVMSASTYRCWAYLLLGLPLGLLWFVLLIPFYITGLALIVVWVGLPILFATHLGTRHVGLFERRLAIALLGARIHPPSALSGSSWIDRAKQVWQDDFAWRSLAWVLLRSIAGPVGAVLAIVGLIAPLAAIAAPIGLIWRETLGSWSWALVSGPILGILLLVVLPRSVSALGDVYAAAAERILGRLFPDPSVVLRAERAEEQVRIDRELHDSIGHVLTMNVVQAGAGAHVFDDDPEFARQALTNIESRGREALAELDRIIEVVRSGEPNRAPVPGLDQIPALIDQIRVVGLPITSELSLSPAPPEVGRAAYRIVQEALTNVVRHAPMADTKVLVASTVDRIEIEVVNGHARQPVPVSKESSSGLAGIRDRSQLLGGSCELGPTPDGGFQVRVVIPFGDR